MDWFNYLWWKLRHKIVGLILGNQWNREEVRHVIINKALCLQGKCLMCNGGRKTSGYLETEKLCKLITEAANKIK